MVKVKHHLPTWALCRPFLQVFRVGQVVSVFIGILSYCRLTVLDVSLEFISVRIVILSVINEFSYCLVCDSADQVLNYFVLRIKYSEVAYNVLLGTIKFN